MPKFNLKSWARLGAEHRLGQVREEISQILRRFPDLEAPRKAPGSPFPPNELAALGGRETASPARRPRRWKMSATQKKAVSTRMKKYWAARRKNAK